MGIMDEYNRLVEIRDSLRIEQGKPPLIRLWDANWSKSVTIGGIIKGSFSFVMNDTGSATIDLPLDHEVSELLMDPDQYPTSQMFLTIDKDGARWSGRIVSVKTDVDYADVSTVRITAKHDYERLKEILVWANPMLPSTVQFPKSWFIFGPLRWCLATTLLLNVVRQNNSLWMLPEKGIGQYFQDASQWDMVVEEASYDLRDVTSVIHSRFKSFHEAAEEPMKDGGVVVNVRRWLPGDPTVHAHLYARITPKPGALIVSFESKKGVFNGDENNQYLETAFTGTTTGGINPVKVRYSPDGTYDIVTPDNRNNPYSTALGELYTATLPSAPWVVFYDGDFTNMNTSSFEYQPASAYQYVTGGHSMPGVNEAIKTAVIAVGGFIGSLFMQSQAGAVVASLMEPLYTDVFMAFLAVKDRGRLKTSTEEHPFEHWASGSEKAFTIASIIAIRNARHETRARYSCEAEMVDGMPYKIGPRGFGDVFIGDRVCVHPKGMPADKLFIEHINEIEYEWSATESKWSMNLGSTEHQDSVLRIGSKVNRAMTGLKELGVW